MAPFTDREFVARYARRFGWETEALESFDLDTERGASPEQARRHTCLAIDCWVFGRGHGPGEKAE